MTAPMADPTADPMADYDASNPAFWPDEIRAPIVAPTPLAPGPAAEPGTPPVPPPTATIAPAESSTAGTIAAVGFPASLALVIAGFGLVHAFGPVVAAVVAGGAVATPVAARQAWKNRKALAQGGRSLVRRPPGSGLGLGRGGSSTGSRGGRGPGLRLPKLGGGAGRRAGSAGRGAGRAGTAKRRLPGGPALGKAARARKLAAGAKPTGGTGRGRPIGARGARRAGPLARGLRAIPGTTARARRSATRPSTQPISRKAQQRKNNQQTPRQASRAARRAEALKRKQARWARRDARWLQRKQRAWKAADHRARRRAKIRRQRIRRDLRRMSAPWRWTRKRVVRPVVKRVRRRIRRITRKALVRALRMLPPAARAEFVRRWRDAVLGMRMWRASAGRIAGRVLGRLKPHGVRRAVASAWLAALRWMRALAAGITAGVISPPRPRVSLERATPKVRRVKPAPYVPPPRPEPAPEPAAEYDDERDSDVPAPVPTPRERPAPVRPPTNPVTRGETMHPACQMSVDGFQEGIGNWEPPEEAAIEDFEDLFASLGPMCEEMGTTLQNLADKIGTDTPLATAINDVLNDFATRMGSMSDDAAEVNATWEREHEYDRNRQFEPRPGEKQLNVTTG